jgi:crossover junction endodeoxyribonuclease RuvC
LTRILGIDPGSHITGFGVVDVAGGRTVYVASGCVRLKGETLAGRLRLIFEGIGDVMAQYRPEEMAVEQVFMHRNADSALKLGQARGAAICAGVMGNLPIAEYSPSQIKQAIVGTGRADKVQVQHMVAMLLGLGGRPQADAADALAVALCHGHTRQTLERMSGVQGARGGRLR